MKTVFLVNLLVILAACLPKNKSNSNGSETSPVLTQVEESAFTTQEGPDLIGDIPDDNYYLPTAIFKVGSVAGNSIIQKPSDCITQNLVFVPTTTDSKDVGPHCSLPIDQTLCCDSEDLIKIFAKDLDRPQSFGYDTRTLRWFLRWMDHGYQLAYCGREGQNFRFYAYKNTNLQFTENQAMELIEFRLYNASPAKSKMASACARPLIKGVTVD